MFRTKTKKKISLSKKPTQRTSVAVMISLFVIAIIIMLSYCSSITEAGTIEYKLITGTNNNKVHIIMLNTGGGSVSIDKNYENFISAKDRNLVADKALEDAMKSAYSDITYRISIRLCSNNETVTFIASRDIFNKLKVGSIVRFEINRSKRDTIERLVRKRYNETFDRIENYAPIVQRNYN